MFGRQKTNSQMKKVLLLAALFVSAMAQAQTADEVVAKYIAAKGGADKLAALKTMRMAMETSVMGQAVSTTATIATGKGVRQDVSVMGQDIITATDGTQGWMINPMAGSSDPQPMPGSASQALMNQMSIGGPLLNYKEKGGTIELIAKEPFEGKDVFVVKLTQKDGSTSTHYINANTYQDVKVVSKAKADGQEVEAEVFFDDYRAVEGYTFPFEQQMTNPQFGRMKIKTTAIEINPTVDEMIFKMPAKK
jgi:outer membrane lipoprotein-sorting protein